MNGEWRFDRPPRPRQATAAVNTGAQYLEGGSSRMRLDLAKNLESKCATPPTCPRTSSCRWRSNSNNGRERRGSRSGILASKGSSSTVDRRPKPLQRPSRVSLGQEPDEPELLRGLRLRRRLVQGGERNLGLQQERSLCPSPRCSQRLQDNFLRARSLQARILARTRRIFLQELNFSKSRMGSISFCLFETKTCSFFFISASARGRGRRSQHCRPTRRGRGEERRALQPGGV